MGANEIRYCQSASEGRRIERNGGLTARPKPAVPVSRTQCLPQRRLGSISGWTNRAIGHTLE
jgi:hypothetical protein